jgi:hypothetical protein
MDKNPKHKSGFQGRESKRRRDLEKAASDPKQKKLFEHSGPSTLCEPSSQLESVSFEPLTSEATPLQSSTEIPSNVIAPLPTELSQESHTQIHEISNEDIVEEGLGTDTRGDCFDMASPKPSTSQDVDIHHIPVIMETDEDFDDQVKRYTDLSMFVAPTANASMTEKLAFLKNHPIQPVGTNISLKFDPSKLYRKVLADGEIIDRRWLSYSRETNKIFCSICMVFSQNKQSPFVSGVPLSIKTIYGQVVKHEEAQTHHEAMRAKLRAEMGKDIGTLLNEDMQSKRLRDITTRRQVVSRIIDIILFIGRQGLSYRGSQEAAYTLDDGNLNHGNFLELVLLVCKYDSILNSHVLKSIQLSKHLKQQKVSDGAQLSKGRGSLLTFLSKSFVNKLVACLTLQIQCSISEEVKQAGTFSIEVDSTQDIAVMDQLAICVRYVHCGKVKVRLIKLVVAKKTTGEALYRLVKSELERLELSTSKIIGCSFDGAANMSGQYNGLQAKLKQDNEDIVHVHC